jgi:hypothetical protein
LTVVGAVCEKSRLVAKPIATASRSARRYHQDEIARQGGGNITFYADQLAVVGTLIASPKGACLSISQRISKDIPAPSQIPFSSSVAGV